MGRVNPWRSVAAAAGVVVLLTCAAPAQAFSWHASDCRTFVACDAAGLGNAGYENDYRASHWGMYGGHNCTNYAAYRLIARGVDASYLRGRGNAYQWGTVAAEHGVTVDGNPRVHDVAWFAASSTMGSSGHVAYVEAVDLQHGRVRVSEDNWGGEFDWRWYDIADVTGFVHFDHGQANSAAAPPVAAPGEAGTGSAATRRAVVTVPATVTAVTPSVPVTWSGADRYSVQYRTVSVDDAGVRRYSTPVLWRSGTTSTGATFASAPGDVHQFRVRAVDRAGGTGPWSGWSTSAVPLDDTALSTTGTWHAGTSVTRYGRTYRYTTEPGAAVFATAWTDRIFVLGAASFGTGRARLWVDGVNRGTVDTYRSTVAQRKVLAGVTLPYGRHTVKLVNEATPGRPYLYLDGIAFRR